MFAPSRPKSPSSKRKPFVSTTKRSITFGTPPPLPPLTPILKEEKASEDFLEQQDASLEEEIDYSHYTNSIQFQQMSIRWINMSTSLWSMIVGHSVRKIVRQSLANFITSLYWRLNGSISEEEFHCLYLEWVSKRSSNAKCQKCDVFMLRDCLLEQATTEEDLEIFLGIIIFEANKGVLNSPLSFNSPHSTASLELCSSRWLSLSEELFFLLDSSGDGFLGFDDFFFLSICLLSYAQSGTDTDFDTRISLTNVAAVAVQLMREADAEVCFDSTWLTASQRNRENIPLEKEGMRPSLDRRLSVAYDDNGRRILPDGRPLVDLPKETVGSEPKIPPPQTGIVTLPMFKSLLIKRSVGEASLVALINFTNERTQHLLSLGEEKGVEVLYSACVHGARGQDIRAPKLWRTCIELIFGYSLENELPTILLYLLTDGSFALPLSLLAYPADESSSAFWTSLKGVSLPDLPHESAFILNYFSSKVWSSFVHWGEVNPSEQKSPDPRDSVFQLISSVLLEYKSSLQLLCAAFVDIAMDPGHTGYSSHSSLQGAITSLLPHPRDCAALWEDLYPQRLTPNPNISAVQVQRNEIKVETPLELGVLSTLEKGEKNRPEEFRNPERAWTPETLEEISHVIWATIFDFQEQATSPRYSTSPGRLSSPQRTINFADRRRRRRNQKIQSPISSNGYPNLTTRTLSNTNSDEAAKAGVAEDESVRLRGQTVDIAQEVTYTPVIFLTIFLTR
jgi:hypothetical protein